MGKDKSKRGKSKRSSPSKVARRARLAARRKEERLSEGGTL